MAAHSLLDISKATHRRKLTPRREPYWRRIAAGCHVGVRVGVQGQTWVARYRKADGTREHRALKEARTYDEAERFARRWFERIGRGIVTGMTVEDACRRYVDQIRIEKGDGQARDAEGRLRRRVYGASFGEILLEDLIPAQVEQWRDSLLDLDGFSPTQVSETPRQHWASRRFLIS